MDNPDDVHDVANGHRPSNWAASLSATDVGLRAGGTDPLPSSGRGRMLEPEVVTMHPTSAPEGLPVLSRGKHRTPRKGACFMEMASVLAGERWSDHPSCTHPLLGYLARLVNDETSDRHRGDLATLIPSVVGVRGGSIAWTIAVSSAVAGRAVTQVPEPTQRVLAAGLYRAEQLADDPVVQRDIRAALQSVPGAVAWVHQFATPGPVTPAQFTRHSAPTMVRCSVQGLVAAGDPARDAILRDLLEVGVAAARSHEPAAPTAPEPSVRYERPGRRGR